MNEGKIEVIWWETNITTAKVRMAVSFLSDNCQFHL